MKELELLSVFFASASGDARIGPTHISMYAAFFQLWKEAEFSNPIIIHRDKVMCLSRIAAPSTYHRILRDLVESGYVTYQPEYSRKGSKLYMIRES